ncbi:MAG TPA: metallophosphoesterase family protein [Clostridiales bacterium]|nr:metallophosphoesterase family protein [Clostridiales bacterium]
MSFLANNPFKTKYSLEFRKDETFKVIQFADLHWESLGEELDDIDQKTLGIMEKLIGIEEPDLIVLTGDIMTSGRKSPVRLSKTVDDVKKAVSIILKPVLESGIPFAFTMGNHEHCHPVDSFTLIKALSEFPSSLVQSGNRKSGGAGDSVIKIKGSKDKKDKWIIYFLDSGCKYEYPVKTYGWIEREQINWYVKQSRRITQKNRRTVPALAFFHIPLPEYMEVWNRKKCYGVKGEEVSCPVLNTGLFSAMVQNKDIKGVFVGHDHDNDYNGNLYGVELCYGRTTGYRMHQKDSFALGARVILLNERENGFNTWIRLENGMVLKKDIDDIQQITLSN